MESEEAGTTTIVANGTGKADENIDASDIAAGNVTEVMDADSSQPFSIEFTEHTDQQNKESPSKDNNDHSEEIENITQEEDSTSNVDYHCERQNLSDEACQKVSTYSEREHTEEEMTSAGETCDKEKSFKSVTAESFHAEIKTGAERIEPASHLATVDISQKGGSHEKTTVKADVTKSNENTQETSDSVALAGEIMSGEVQETISSKRKEMVPGSADECMTGIELPESKDSTSAVDESAHTLGKAVKNAPVATETASERKSTVDVNGSIHNEIDVLNVSTRATYGDSSCDNLSISEISESKSGGFERTFSVERMQTDETDINQVKEERLEQYLESMRSVSEPFKSTETACSDEKNKDHKDTCKSDVHESEKHETETCNMQTTKHSTNASEKDCEDNTKKPREGLQEPEYLKITQCEVEEMAVDKGNVSSDKSTESSNGEKSQTDLEVARIMRKGKKNEEDKVDAKVLKTSPLKDPSSTALNENTSIPDVEVDPKNEKEVWETDNKTESENSNKNDNEIKLIEHRKTPEALFSKEDSDKNQNKLPEKVIDIENEKDTVSCPEKETESAFVKVPIGNKWKKDSEQPREILKRKIFDEFTEDSSNSSWYIIKDKSTEEPMDSDDKNRRLLGTDEGSNLSIPDDSSIVSGSAMEDSRLSFTDQFTNMDETSNLSAGDSCSVKAFGHELVLDESANLNPPDKDLFVQPSTPSSVITDATSEATPVKRYRRGTLAMAVEEASEHGHNIQAKDLFEYQWPQESGADWFMLQEQISAYLEVKSFKRKYPDLFRRVCDKMEKDFLREKGVVSETQSDLGLTALKSEEVHELLSKDYPSKYREYCAVLHEKEKEIMVSKQKDYVLPKFEKSKMKEYTLKAMKSTSEWNRHFLKERNEERRAYFDMQTFAVHYPRNKFRKVENIKSVPTAYPVSLIPGQFQEYYRKYSVEELKYYPLNTVLYDPPKKMEPGSKEARQAAENQVKEVPKGGSCSEPESESSSESGESDEEDKNQEENVKEKTVSREASAETNQESVSVKDEALEVCWVCDEEEKQGKLKNKRKKSLSDEELVGCSECKKRGHASCLDLTDSMLKVIKTYPWQCMECKTCVECMDPTDEDKMLFCDRCDRGYHTFCVGLKSLPTGKWECVSCRGDGTPVKPGPKPQAKSATKGKRGRKPKNQEAR